MSILQRLKTKKKKKNPEKNSEEDQIRTRQQYISHTSTAMADNNIRLKLLFAFSNEKY